MSKKHKRVCTTLASLVGIPIGITSSANGLKICVIIAAIKK